MGEILAFYGNGLDREVGKITKVNLVKIGNLDRNPAEAPRREDLKGTTIRLDHERMRRVILDRRELLF